MKPNDGLSRLEDNIYQEYSRDGAVLTMLGLYILWAGLCIVAWPFPWDHFGIAAWPIPWNGLIPLCIIAPLLLFLRLAWTKQITVPRLGYAKSAVRRDLPRHRKWRYMWIMVAIGLPLGVWMRVSLSKHSGMLHTDKQGIVGLAPIIVALGLATTKVNLTKRQFWTLVALTFGLVALASLLGIDEGWAVAIVGLILTGLGLVRLRGFLRDYPRREETHEQ